MIPDCATPRPGEEVLLYQGKTRFQGIFHGYDVNDRLMVRHAGGSIIGVDDPVQVRLVNPYQRQRPCWEALPDCAHQQAAAPEEKQAFDALLNERFSPGPTYLEFVNEIWLRGYEVFLVGGAVRDVLQGGAARDVDLITSMPFSLLEGLVKSMFGELGFSRSPNDGFMSVGSNAGNDMARSEEKGPCVDVKNFFRFAPGTDNAEFSADLYLDHTLRDFACNAVYYDAINGRFIDPSGTGIEDARRRTLRLVNDPEFEHPVFKKATIPFRLIKFTILGYTPTQECIEVLQRKFKPFVKALTRLEAMTLFQYHILGRVSDIEQTQVLRMAREQMSLYCLAEIWTDFYAGYDKILTDGL